MFILPFIQVTITKLFWQNLIWKFISHHHIQDRFGILKKQKLTSLEEHDFNWERAFSNTNVNEKVCIFNKFVLNVLSNFIPHKAILCNDNDLRWFNSQVNSLLLAKNKVFKICRKDKTNIQLLNKLNFLQGRLNGLITTLKINYSKASK